jgi:hypothetical protein
MHAQTGPLIRVHPATALIDVCRSIRLHGFLPAQPVEVAATLREHDGRVWRICATFLTDGDGSVDLATAAPISGSYRHPSAMGLVWSMHLEEGGPGLDSSILPEAVVSQVIRLEVRQPDGAVTATDFEQCFLAPGVTRCEIHEDGVVGVLFTPPEHGPHPLIIQLTGSSGGVFQRRAALLPLMAIGR